MACLVMAAGNDHARAFVSKGKGGGTADAGQGAGYQDDGAAHLGLSFEIGTGTTTRIGRLHRFQYGHPYCHVKKKYVRPYFSEDRSAQTRSAALRIFL
jgi:hypothetical protein